MIIVPIAATTPPPTIRRAPRPAPAVADARGSPRVSAALAATLEPGDRLYARVGQRRIVTGTFTRLGASPTGDLTVHAVADGSHLELAPVLSGVSYRIVKIGYSMWNFESV